MEHTKPIECYINGCHNCGNTTCTVEPDTAYACTLNDNVVILMGMPTPEYRVSTFCECWVDYKIKQREEREKHVKAAVQLLHYPEYEAASTCILCLMRDGNSEEPDYWYLCDNAVPGESVASRFPYCIGYIDIPDADAMDMCRQDTE